MLYIVSGASRAGKTIIAKRISKQRGISYFSIDWLIMGFTNGIPEYGVHDMLMPDEIAKKSWSFLKAMLISMLQSKVDYIIEGEAILPELIIELTEKYPNKFKVCFLGFTDVDIDKKVNEIKNYSKEQKDWLSDKSDEYITDHVNNMISHSIKIGISCKAHNLTYFDTSKNFTKATQDAINYLLTTTEEK